MDGEEQGTVELTEVDEFLTQLGAPFVQYRDALLSQGFDSLEALEAAERSDLQEAGLRRGHAILLAKKLKERKAPEKVPAGSDQDKEERRASEKAQAGAQDEEGNREVGLKQSLVPAARPTQDEAEEFQVQYSSSGSSGEESRLRTVNVQLRRILVGVLRQRRKAQPGDGGFMSLAEVRSALPITYSLSDVENVLLNSRHRGYPRFQAKKEGSDVLIRLTPKLGFYKVKHLRCAIRLKPEENAEVIGARRQGQVVEFVEFDRHMQWGRLSPRSLGGGRTHGWMLLHHKE